MAKKYAPKMSDLEKTLTRVTDHIEDMLSQDKTMYKNTKESLGRIMIQAQRLMQLIENSNQINTDNKSVPQIVESENSDTPTTVQVSDTSEKKTTSKSYNHNFVVDYANVLSKVAQQTSADSEIGKLARLIDRWFHIKFIDDTYKTMGWKRFRYNISYFNKWIYTIVIYYGYCYEKDDGSLETFIAEFYDWIDAQHKDQSLYEKFEMPAKLHFCCKKMNKAYCTTTALILWDMYVDAGFSEMCQKRIIYKEAPNPEGVQNLIQKYAPELDEEYDGYKDDEALLEQFKMI